MFIFLGADLDAIDTERNTPFDLAEELEIKSIIASGSNLLYIAIAKGNSAEVTRIIQQTGMSANTIFSSRMSALQVACQYEQVEQVDFLLKHGADVNYQVSIGMFSSCLLRWRLSDFRDSVEHSLTGFVGLMGSRTVDSLQLTVAWWD